MLLKFLILGLIKGYRKTSRIKRWLLPPFCRFYPTCSEYGYLAVERHGVRKGLTMLATRLFKCHPLHPGGIDPVPEIANPHKEHTLSQSGDSL